MVGVYERLLTALFQKKIAADTEQKYFYGERPVAPQEAARLLSGYVAEILEKVLRRRLEDNGSVEDAVKFVNDAVLHIASSPVVAGDDLLDAGARILTAVLERTGTDEALNQELQRLLPNTGLTRSSLFSGAGEGFTLASELAREILSADRIDWLVSFVRQSGIAPLMKSLEEATGRGAKFRLLTTTYMAVSDFAAIKRLAQLPNTEVRISYDENTTRLHAKAYLFYRNTLSHSVYVGSSNLSAAAIGSGMEWNVKSTSAESPALVQSMFERFERYWNDSSLFVPYTPGDDERLEKALSRPYMPLEYSSAEQNSLENTDGLPLAPFELFDYQEEVLTKIADARRDLHSHRNLVVAATGTGKTVIAANDFKRFLKTHPDATLLFIVHREEIIRQARETFRRVLEDENFGEMWFSGVRPSVFRHVFASVATLSSQLKKAPFPRDAFDYIIVDEAHHVTAPSYAEVLSQFDPKVLLGLTATPERLDNADVRKVFDGRYTAEIRLADAINKGMLVPFTYYGVPDVVDLSGVRWKGGQYVASDLSQIFINSPERSTHILDVVRDKIPNFDQIQALAFCVDQAHARAMTAAFDRAGYRVACLTSDNSNQREELLNKLKSREINCLFVVDMFNEGVDIPGIDTVLFLRPTQSLTVFLQQLGRGLRRAKNKFRLRVLDFIARTRAEYDWSRRLGALMGFNPKVSASVIREAIRTDNYPYLPKGCQISLTDVAQCTVLKNIEDHINRLGRDSAVVDTLRDWMAGKTGEPSLEAFLADTGLSLDHIYKRGTWTRLKSALTGGRDPGFDKRLQRAVYNRWLLIDDADYIEFLIRLVRNGFSIDTSSLSQSESAYLMMFYYDYFDSRGLFATAEQMLSALQADAALREELRELLPLLRAGMSKGLRGVSGAPGQLTPLKLYGRYTKGEILSALQRWTLNSRPDQVTGVSYGDLKPVEKAPQQAEVPFAAMFVTVNKDGKTTTAYKDYAIDGQTFHWQSPNSASEGSAEGKKLLDPSRLKLLFVRHFDMVDNQRRETYSYLGPVRYVSHTGEKPISFVWRTDYPIPEEVYQYARHYQN